MKGSRILSIGFAALPALLLSCYYDVEEILYPGSTNCNGVAVDYVTNVEPLVLSRCATTGCHNAGSANGPGPLTTLQQVSSAAQGVKTSVLAGRMPKGSTLTTDEIKTIRCWVDSGTPGN